MMSFFSDEQYLMLTWFQYCFWLPKRFAMDNKYFVSHYCKILIQKKRKM